MTTIRDQVTVWGSCFTLLCCSGKVTSPWPSSQPSSGASLTFDPHPPLPSLPYSPVQPSRPQSDGPNNNLHSNYRPEKHRCIVDTSLCIQYYSYIPLCDKRQLSPTTAKSFRKLCVANHPIVVPFCHTRPVVPIAAADITAVFVLFDIGTRQSTNNTASLVHIGITTINSDSHPSDCFDLDGANIDCGRPRGESSKEGSNGYLASSTRSTKGEWIYQKVWLVGELDGGLDDDHACEKV